VDFSPRTIAEALAIVAVVLAVIAGIADYRQRKRIDLDRVALLDWRSVQVFALIAAIIIGGLAFRI
jgi:uncharacterized membrane protein